LTDFHLDRSGALGETGLLREGIMWAKQMINWYYIIHNY
jgi:hypothetical protein